MIFLRDSVLLWRRSILCLLLVFFTINLAFTQQKVVSGRTTSEAIDSLQEVAIVAVGYGTQKIREITSSISRVKSEEFNKGNINNPIQLIQGKVSGLSISKPGGDPNSFYYMRIRGLSSIVGNTQPLVIIDGMIGGSPDNVDPNDIESIDMLKDGSSSAIYGTRGSNGVILITTWKGKKGSAAINYNFYTTVEKVARNAPAMNAAEWRGMSGETGLGTDFGTNTDWFKEIEQTAISQVHNVSISGGSDKTTYRASLNYRLGKGIEINTGYNQLNGRFNITQKALKDKFTMTLNLGATERESQYGFADAFHYASIYNPTAPVRSTDAEYTKYDGYFQQLLYNYCNPVSILELNKNEGNDRIVNLSLKGTYEIIHGLSLNAFYSVQNSAKLRGQYFDKNDFLRGVNWNGLASRQEDNSTSRLFETTAHYNSDINPVLNLSVLGGYSYQDFTNEGFYVEGGNFLTDAFSFNNLNAALDFKNGIGTATSYKNSNNLISFFGRINLISNSTWFLTASARYDGSSRFGTDKKWGLFPAIGGGVDIAKFLNISFINNLKLRLNYGLTGNEPPENYMSLLRLAPMGNSYYNGTFIPAYSPASNPNPDLKWETKGEFDTGFDFSLFKSKLSGSFDYYTQSMKDLLYQYQVPVPPNLYYVSWLNLGKIKNSGLELTLNWNVIKKSDFSYSITLTRSHNLTNKLVSITGTYNGTTVGYRVQDMGSLNPPGNSGLPLVRVEEGKPVGQLISYVFKEIDENGNLILVDENHDGYINYSDLRVVGNGLPKVMFGFGNTVTFKNLDLNIFFRGVSGYDLINSYRATYEVPNYIAYYNLPKTAADMRNPVTGALLNNSSGLFSSIDIENASFVTLDNMALGYNFALPASSSISKIRLYLAGNNLFYITRYKGADPNPRYEDSIQYYGTYANQLVPGVDRRDTWPRTRSVTFGANIIF